MNSCKYRIGILGGSFNPPHAGHVFISDIAIKKLGLQSLLWLVSPQNPLKEKSNNNDDFKDRVELCKKLTEGNKKIIVSDLEKTFFPNNTKFYTINFLKRFVKKFPNYQIKFIIGADNLVSFHRWKFYKEIEKYCEIIVINRVEQGFNLKYKSQKSKFGNSGKYKFINAKSMDISSTRLRNDK